MNAGFLLRLLLPGGNVDLETSQFSRASRIFYDLALRVDTQCHQTWDGSTDARRVTTPLPLSLSLPRPLQANKAGDFFPIWGTCQGLQQLSVLTADQNLLTDTDTEAVALPLNLTPGALLLPMSSALLLSFNILHFNYYILYYIFII